MTAWQVEIVFCTTLWAALCLWGIGVFVSECVRDARERKRPRKSDAPPALD